ncbi:uncharacterized protein B0P05DRAFT_587210 [Gilbertella persicaria]|uniref:Uncharacterized protein n=1 Tax=Rhizopus stolonifer TaxID=4846 RepID=A0A367K3M7_RHIST|nr:uncharacterized protein B0P05DRAFT_587210 [Gilbertella persicaria]KAI8078976.1 hypothetical protein B0P05DRAFT_587210 [Gilbertella persicaria]RCH96813.1 hypothetical protein CU098_011051 [Rhizopus stolonifer]
MHKDVNDTHPDKSSSLGKVQSRIYRSYRPKDAFLLDITKVKAQYTDLQCLQEIKAQRPTFHACSFLKDGSARYLEIYIESQHDVNDLGANHSVPSHRSEALEGLKVSLSPFGQVIDVGIITEPNTGFFMGSDYAVIGIPRQSGEDQIKYQELAHNIR